MCRAMLFQNVAIHALAYADPPQRMTSAAVSDRLAPALRRFGLGTSFLQEATGIVARRFWGDGVQPSQAAALAGERALATAGISKDRVGLLVSTSVCKDYIEPSVASMVHGRLGLSSDCINFDVGNACLAFLNAMTIAGNMIERRQIDHALIVDGEQALLLYEKTIERLLRPDATIQSFRDNLASLTLGSAAVAMVLSRSDLAPGGHRFRGGVSVAASEHNHLCRGQVDEMVTDSAKLLTAGVALAQRTWEKAETELGWREEDLDECVLHQVSRAHTEQLSDALGLQRSKVFAIFPEHGNVGPAGVPLTLAKAAEAGRLAEGWRVALMGIGSGLNCAMMEVVW